MAAAIRASVAAQQQQQQQQETHRTEDREEGSRPKKEEAGLRGPEEACGPRRPARTPGEGPGEQLPCRQAHPGPTGRTQAPDNKAGEKPRALQLVTPPGLILPPRHCLALTRVLVRLVGPKEASANGPVNQDTFSTTGPAAGATLPKYMRVGLGAATEGWGGWVRAPGLLRGWGLGQARACRPLTPVRFLHSALPSPTSKLKDEDFPSLCASALSSSSAAAAPGPVGLALAYSVSARGRTTFQEEDFPALVPSASKPSSAPTSLISAWNSGASKKVAHPAPGSQSTSGGSQPPRKSGKGGKGGKKGGPSPAEEAEEDGRAGLTAQELRSVPTTVAVSSLLAGAATQTFTKAGKKKKVGSEKSGAASPPPPDREGPPGAELAPTAPPGRAEGPAAVIVNGHSEGLAPARSTPKEPPGLPRPLGPPPCPTPQEDFPALCGPCPPRMPPPPGRCAGPGLPRGPGKGLG